MKILYYSSSPLLTTSIQSGPGTHIREMINGMKELGHEVLPVIIGDEISTTGEETTVINKKGIIFSLAKKIIPSVVWRSLKELKLIRFDKHAEQILEEKVRVFKPDLIYERSAYLQTSGINIAKKYKIKHYMEINAPFIEEVKQFENSDTFLVKQAINFERELITSPDKVFVVSSGIKKYYSKYSTDTNKIIVMPNSINLDVIKVNVILKLQLENEFNTKGKTVIGFVGSIFPYHGVDILIKGFAKYQLTNPASVLLIVGDGYIIPELKELAKELNIPPYKVIFTGSVKHKDVFTYIDLMDITVLAKSNWFCSPIKIFEYGAMNKAVIAVNTIGVKDVMGDGVDGLLIDPTEENLFRALSALTNDEARRKQMAQHFHDKVVANYTWRKTAEVVLS
jgi:glycosyltransferase involved in cell wall biosynthesis